MSLHSERTTSPTRRWLRLLDRILLGPPGSLPGVVAPVMSGSVTGYPVDRAARRRAPGSGGGRR